MAKVTSFDPMTVLLPDFGSLLQSQRTMFQRSDFTETWSWQSGLDGLSFFFFFFFSFIFFYIADLFCPENEQTN